MLVAHAGAAILYCLVVSGFVLQCKLMKLRFEERTLFLGNCFR
jgi:hypothetical protein